MSDYHEDSPVQASRLSFSAGAVVALVLALLSLIGTAGLGAWQVRGQLEKIEAKLDHVSDDNLREAFYTRREAGAYHSELERALNRAGLKVDFPPPRDPNLGYTDHHR